MQVWTEQLAAKQPDSLFFGSKKVFSGQIGIKTRDLFQKIQFQDKKDEKDLGNYSN
ncbi:MAG: hypothetical protein ACJA2C_001713 [Marinoscillum sp.]|jgi:hypothetical protein